MTTYYLAPNSILDYVRRKQMKKRIFSIFMFVLFFISSTMVNALNANGIYEIQNNISTQGSTNITIEKTTNIIQQSSSAYIELVFNNIQITPTFEIKVNNQVVPYDANLQNDILTLGFYTWTIQDDISIQMEISELDTKIDYNVELLEETLTLIKSHESNITGETVIGNSKTGELTNNLENAPPIDIWSGTEENKQEGYSVSSSSSSSGGSSSGSSSSSSGSGGSVSFSSSSSGGGSSSSSSSSRSSSSNNSTGSTLTTLLVLGAMGWLTMIWLRDDPKKKK